MNNHIQTFPPRTKQFLLPCRTSTNLFLLLRVAVVLVLCFVQKADSQDSSAMIYLANYGYLPANVKNPSSGSLISEESFSQAVAEFQSFAGINVTGSLDPTTIATMRLPRCGVRDKVGQNDRAKRYALQGSRWRVKDLTYKISKYPKALAKEEVDKEVKKAFSVWSDYTDLTFSPKKVGSVHIEIRFEKGEHGDGDPFDGPGGTLAHAYFPVYGGDAHFDDDEVWTINTYRGTNLFQVAAHEFGHSLGLSHSDTKSALMAPFYRGYQPQFELDEDDIQGIQVLYGKKSRGSGGSSSGGGSSGGSRTTEASNSVDDDLELCSNSKIDTVFSSGDFTYVFKGDKYWRLDEDGVASGYPKLISKTWAKLPNSIDAAFTYKNGKTYFFKGNQYWRYVGTKLDGDYPKPISSGFSGIPDNIDAALVWSGNGKIYFFKGDKFWRFDPSQKPPVKSTYPKPLSNWDGIPSDIDAALQYTNGYTYFFKRGKYWRFNDRSFSVDAASPAFPRSAAFWWYGCKEATKGTLGNEAEEYKGDASSEISDDHGLTVDDLILDAAGTMAPKQDPESQQPQDGHPDIGTGVGAGKDRAGGDSGGTTTATSIMLTTIAAAFYVITR